MQRCLYIHPDNVRRSRNELKVQVALVARPDWFMAENEVEQVIVETERGVHTRCFMARYRDIPFLIVYGRFGRVRTTSHDINFELTQEVFSFLGIRHVVGTFVVGSVRDTDRAGTVYVPDDLIGLGAYNQARTRHRRIGFRTVDMLNPFCPELRQVLLDGADGLSFQVRGRGTYACFHGWPRLETAAELRHYAEIGCEMVGQTLDPEATLAREGGCCYAAIAVAIDDAPLRTRLLEDDPSALDDIKRHTRDGRRKTFEVFLAALPRMIELPPCDQQAKMKKAVNMDFYYRPHYLIDDCHEHDET